MTAYERYISAVNSALEIETAAEWKKLPFQRKGRDCVFDIKGLKTEIRVDGVLDLMRTSALKLDKPFTELLPFCRSKAVAGNGLILLEIADIPRTLDYLCCAELLSDTLRERLENFLKIRPLYEPALRTGLGIILRTGERPSVYFSARLLNGYDVAPKGFFLPVGMNLELTRQCPLRCPQCYCHLMKGQHMPLETAEKWLHMAGELGCRQVSLSGGETMCYPWIYEVIGIARENGLTPDVALSGYGITEQTLDRLIDAGVGGIYASLNGPTEEINRKTRDGYSHAIKLLELLKKKNYEDSWINWVVHDSNAHLLPEMLRVAEEYNIRNILVIAFKPDSSYELPSIPSREQLLKLKDDIRAYDGSVEITVESCYSSLRALVGRSFMGNRNRGTFKGCGAGRYSFSVALDGRLAPCRHLDLFEDADDLFDWWQNSPTLEKLRKVTDSTKEPCSSCTLSEYCLHCMAVNQKLNGEIYRGDATCPLAGI